MPARRRNTYRFGDAEFTSRDKTRRFFSEIRARYEDWETIVDPADYKAVVDLLQGHCQREEKIGCGVARFFVAPAPDHSTSRCFWLERTDGTETDFGFNACIDGISQLNRQDFRRLINPQILEFKGRRLAGCLEIFVSDLSGLSNPVAEAHADHVTGFEEIVVQFAEREKLNLETELLTIARDASSEPTWKDAALASRFFAFHATFELRLITKAENLGRPRRKEDRAPGLQLESIL